MATRDDGLPADYPVRVIRADDPTAKDPVTCGDESCGRTWDDGVSTSMTPTPSGRCPFEYWHDHDDEDD